MIDALKKHIDHNLSFLKNKKLLLTVSGGIDSIVLAYLIHKLDFTIEIAHCNFQLRGAESDKDEVFVTKFAEKLNTPIHVIHFDTETYAKKKKTSIQIAARELRYNWFNKLLADQNLDYILTAHHQDDAIETFLINFTRGTGLDGLTGIPTQNGNIVRPLLGFTRNEIESYALKNEITWREDESNSSTKYFRNKIRHQITPILKELNPQFNNSFKKTIENLNNSKTIINNNIDEIKKKYFKQKGDVIEIDIHGLKSLNKTKDYLFELFKDYGFTEWNDVENLIDTQSGKQVSSKNFRLIKNRETLLLSPISSTNTETLFAINKDENKLITDYFSIIVSQNNLENSTDQNTITVDKNLLAFPLTVRKWKKGDYFHPSGMNGKKKISKYLKDIKASLLDKENTWLLCNNDGKVIWVIGKRLDNRFLPKIETTNTLTFTLE